MADDALANAVIKRLDTIDENQKDFRKEVTKKLDTVIVTAAKTETRQEGHGKAIAWLFRIVSGIFVGIVVYLLKQHGTGG